MRDHILEPDSMVAERMLPFVPTVAATITNRIFAAYKLDHPSLASRLRLYCRDVTGVVSIQATLSSGDGLFNTPALAIDATPEDFKLGAHSGRIGSTIFYKAAATGISFTAAHVVTALKFGIILIQETAAGVVSSKVPAATPTTAMAYNTAAAALAALPAADASNVAVGYILINADAGDWTANTDDMTDGSDLTTAVFVGLNNGATAVNLLASSPAFVDAQVVDATMATDVNSRVGRAGDLILLGITGDGTAALADPQVTLGVRPFPLGGEVTPA